MTVAVCLKCGELKHGAWTPCGACNYVPDDDESYTKHVLATDHYLSRADLEAMASRVKAGELIEFPPDLLKQAWVRKADIDRKSRGCSLGCIAAIAFLILGAVTLAFWRLH